MLKLQRFDIFGHQTLFTNLLIALNVKKAMRQLGYSNDDVSKVPMLFHRAKIYFYDLRHGDDDSIPLTLERLALVNRFGRIFTLEPLLKEYEDNRPIFEDDWGFQSDLPDCTLIEFVNEMQSRAKQIL